LSYINQDILDELNLKLLAYQLSFRNYLKLEEAFSDFGKLITKFDLEEVKGLINIWQI